MKKQQIIAPLLVAAFSATALSGCMKPKAKPYEVDFNADVRGTTIKFWAGFGSDLSNQVEDLCDEFSRLTGVKVLYESKSDYNSCLKAVTLAATSGAYPNVVVGYPDHFASYVKQDIIVRLDYYFENDVRSEAFEPEGERFTKETFYSDYMVENQSIEYDQDGKPYTLGVPFNKSTEVMIYNKTFFDWCANQDDLKTKIYVPKTYDEVSSVGAEILNLFETRSVYGKVLYADGTTTKGSQNERDIIIDLTGIVNPKTAKDDVAQFRPFSYDSQANWFISMVRQFGGQYTEFDKKSEKGYLAFKSDETKNALNYLKGLYDNYVIGFPANWGEAKYGSKPFQANKCVMTVGSSAGVANSAPAGNKFKIAAAPVPYKDAAKKFVISQGANLALLSTGDAKQFLASWQLVKFLSKYANGSFCSQTGYFPSTPYAEKALDGQETSGMWAGVKEDEYSDYCTWLSEAKASDNQTDNIRAQTAEVNLDSYVKEGENWTKFVDQPFSGSASIREEVASIIPWVLTGQKSADEAINTIYSKLSDYVRA